jgi:hypothetical protein
MSIFLPAEYSKTSATFRSTTIFSVHSFFLSAFCELNERMAKLENWLFLKIVKGYDRIGCPVVSDLKKGKTSFSKS